MPMNWCQICIHATVLIRQNVSSSRVTRLVNADQMFFQFYLKEPHLIASTNIHCDESNQGKDAKKV